MGVNIARAIAASFPSADPNPIMGNFSIHDDGTGPYVFSWDANAIGSPKPSQEDVAAMIAAYVEPLPLPGTTVEGRLVTLETAVAALEGSAAAAVVAVAGTEQGA